MPGRLSVVAALVVIGLVAASALGVEPISITAEGVVSAGAPNEAPPRDAAFRAALLAAVVEAARGMVAPERADVDAERLRAELEPRVQSFVLTYRIDGGLTRRASPLDPGVQEWVLPVSARIDAAALQTFLRRAGFLRDPGDRPSVALRTRAVGALASRPPAGALAHLEQTLRTGLSAKDFVVVESALRPGGDEPPKSALELARAVGADVALELEVDWRPNAVAGGAPGGVAELRARALRSADGGELAISRFEAAGYDPLQDAAIARALSAIEPQLAENLALQLERNWLAEGHSERPVDLELDAVTGFAQVGAVRRALLGPLGATEADVRELRPGGAVLRVVSKLSAGALQERLASLAFDGFALAPVEAGAGRARLRVEARAPAPESLAPGASQIDAPDRN
jgi:hypothetical protein